MSQENWDIEYALGQMVGDYAEKYNPAPEVLSKILKSVGAAGVAHDFIMQGYIIGAKPQKLDAKFFIDPTEWAEANEQKIKGYRNLTKEEIDLINEIKEKAEEVGDLCDRIKDASALYDTRWVLIGREDLQKGFMALTRAVAKPEGF